MRAVVRSRGLGDVYKRQLQNRPAELSLVRIEAPVELLRGLTVVDSPGTGDMLWRFDPVSYTHLTLPTSDLV